VFGLDGTPLHAEQAVGTREAVLFGEMPTRLGWAYPDVVDR
jgi:hypothetical protein